MNKQRRKDLERAEELLREAQAIIQQARDEEQEYRDNLPDNMQDGERADAIDGNISCLEDADQAIDEICDTLAGATGGQ
jgi:type II secretory pathway pseudopilin PulG